MRPGENEARTVVADKRENWEARVQMAVITLPKNELSIYDKMAYAILCGHANRDGNAMLRVRTLAAEVGCSERQAQRALANLKACGLLTRSPQFSNGRRIFNICKVYKFNMYASPNASAPEAELESTGTVSSLLDSHWTQDSRLYVATELRSLVTELRAKGDSGSWRNNRPLRKLASEFKIILYNPHMSAMRNLNLRCRLR
jgi:DNA-binding transcriptional MocR family regulator